MITAAKIEEFSQQCEERKKSLSSGPWFDEPHRVEFEHAGLNCLLLRNPSLFNWCGYVGVPPEHSLYGFSYNAVDIEAHGGLTYSDGCQGHVCHITDKPDQLHWFGFDCAHFGDLVPAIEGMNIGLRDSEYRTMNYAKQETMRLAEQLAEIKKP